MRTIQYSDEDENRFVYDIFGNVLEAENTSGKELFRYDTGGYLIYQQDLSSGVFAHAGTYRQTGICITEPSAMFRLQSGYTLSLT